MAIDMSQFDNLAAKINSLDLREGLEAVGEVAQAELERSFAGGRATKSGRLKRSFTRQGEEGNLFRVTDNQIEVGSDLVYADVQDKRFEIIPPAALVQDKLQAVLSEHIAHQVQK